MRKRTPTHTNPAPSKRPGKEAAASTRSDISNFLEKASSIGKGEGRGKLIFALDATMSRQHTWDAAMHMQADMFDAVASTGGLDIQLVYFRGFGECRASRWVNNTHDLRDLMTGIQCRGGKTQIGKMLGHCQKEVSRHRKPSESVAGVSAVVFVGDAMEEDVDSLCNKAGELGLQGVPLFLFQEGHDAITEQAFREMARLSRGAYMKFDSGSAAQLAELLRAVARFASGGRAALENSSSKGERLLLDQLK